jgi:hypothetical protein
MLACTDPVALDIRALTFSSGGSFDSEKHASGIPNLAYAANCGAGSLKHTLVDFCGNDIYISTMLEMARFA